MKIFAIIGFVCLGTAAFFFLKADYETPTVAAIMTGNNYPNSSKIDYETCKKQISLGYWWMRGDEQTGVSLKFVVCSIELKDVIQKQGERLSIYDELGKEIYHEDAVSFSGIDQQSVLGQNSSQLIIRSVNYGGSGRFFKILDIRDKKVVDLTESVDTLYDGFAEIVPQFQQRSGVDNLPFEILLTSSLLNKPIYARVIRYINGKYVMIGEFPRQDVASFMETRIRK